MSGRKFLVVGGSSGIGLSLVKRLVAHGHEVWVLSRSNSNLTGLERVTHFALDISQDEVPSEMIPDVLDGLAYCAGSINLGPLRRLKAESLEADFRLNVVGAVKAIQAALPALRKGDHPAVLMFSSVAVNQGMAMHASVSASKGAVEGLMRSLAAELAPKIRVNCIAPSLTDTPLTETLLSNDQKRAAMADRHPLKRVGTSDELAATAEFLLSEDATWITGQVIGVDGGMSSIRG